MATLGLVGLVVGTIAQATVDESVRWKIESQLAEQPEHPHAKPATT